MRGSIEGTGTSAARPIDSFEPRFLPVQQAACLASPMRRAVTSCRPQVDGAFHAPHAGGRDRVAEFVSNLLDGHLATAELQHLRHERQRVQFTVLVERGEDLRLRADLNDVADPQAQDAPVPVRLHSGPHLVPSIVTLHQPSRAVVPHDTRPVRRGRYRLTLGFVTLRHRWPSRVESSVT